MNKTNKAIYLLINLALVSLGGYLLFFTSFFSMGSEEQHRELIDTAKAEYFFSRFFVNLITISIVIGVIALINFIFRKVIKQKSPFKKILLFNTVALLLISIVMIYLSM
jgi:hypothetical protein